LQYSATPLTALAFTRQQTPRLPPGSAPFTAAYAAQVCAIEKNGPKGYYELHEFYESPPSLIGEHQFVKFVQFVV
jgi:hypothetical protein